MAKKNLNNCEKLYPSYKVMANHKMYDEDFTERPMDQNELLPKDAERGQ